MELRETLHLDISKKIRGKRDSDSDSSSESDSEAEVSVASSAAESNASTAFSSPRSLLMWDHSYDTANKTDHELELDTVREGALEWKRFKTLSLTDDDKLHADKASTRRGIFVESEKQKLGKPNGGSPKSTSSELGLPDLIPAGMNRPDSASPFSEPPPLPVSAPPGMEESVPPLPKSKPPVLQSDLPPPLPESKPPDIETSDKQTVIYPAENSEEDSDSESSTSSTLEETSGESDGDEGSESSPDEVFHKPDETIEQGPILSPPSMFKGQPKEALLLDIDEEFDTILSHFEPEKSVFGRRDYGLPLSPIIESPSPTLSSLSSLSSASPDPLSMFRMSPGPRGKRENDLSSLSIKKQETFENEEMGSAVSSPQSVGSPRGSMWKDDHDVYDNRDKTKSSLSGLSIPEPSPWDSDAELNSPAGSDWEQFKNGLSSPQFQSPSNSGHFGSFPTSRNRLDKVFEEPESAAAEESSSAEDTDDDTDDTIGRDDLDLDTGNEDSDTPASGISRIARGNDPRGLINDDLENIKNNQHISAEKNHLLTAGDGLRKSTDTLEPTLGVNQIPVIADADSNHSNFQVNHRLINRADIIVEVEVHRDQATNETKAYMDANHETEVILDTGSRHTDQTDTGRKHSGSDDSSREFSAETCDDDIKYVSMDMVGGVPDKLEPLLPEQGEITYPMNGYFQDDKNTDLLQAECDGIQYIDNIDDDDNEVEEMNDDDDDDEEKEEEEDDDTEEEEFETQEIDLMNQSSSGSFVRVSQYTSEESDDSEPDQNRLEDVIRKFSRRQYKEKDEGENSVLQQLENLREQQSCCGGDVFRRNPIFHLRDHTEKQTPVYEDKLDELKGENNAFIDATPAAISNSENHWRNADENTHFSPDSQIITTESSTGGQHEARERQLEEQTKPKQNEEPKIRISHLARKKTIRDQIRSGTVENLSRIFTVKNGEEKLRTYKVIRRVDTDTIDAVSALYDNPEIPVTVTEHENCTENTSGSDDNASLEGRSHPGVKETLKSQGDRLHQPKVRLGNEELSVCVNERHGAVNDDKNTDEHRKPNLIVYDSDSENCESDESGESFGKYISSEDELDGQDGRMRMDPGDFQIQVYNVQAPSWRTSKDGKYRMYGKKPGRELIGNVKPKGGGLPPQAVYSDARHDKHSVEVSAAVACQSEGTQGKIQVNRASTQGRDKKDALPEKSSISCVVKNEQSKNKGGDIPRTITEPPVHQSSEMRNGSALRGGETVGEYTGSSRADANTSQATQSISHAYMSSGNGEKHVVKTVVTGSRSRDEAVSFEPSRSVNVIEDELGKMKIWPYSEIEDSERVPVKVHTNRRVAKMPVTSSGIKVIQSSQRSSGSSDDRTMEKFNASSVVPYNASSQQMMQTHADSIQSALQMDANGNTVSEEEIAAVLPKIAESVANMKNTNAEEILPGITQSVTKLQNGGNLVITTMTRKVTEEEEDDGGSSGRGSPVQHPVINVDDLDNNKIFLVEDSRGDLFVVEDVTSESQESAYYSSSRHTSESDGSISPLHQRVSQIRKVGEGNINESTAEELISAMYNQSGIIEIDETEEDFSERTYEYEIPQRRGGPVNSSEMTKTQYMVEEPDGTSYGQPPVSTTKTTTRDEYEIEMSTVPWIYDGQQGQQQGVIMQANNAGRDEMDSASTITGNDGMQMKMKKTYKASDTANNGCTSSSTVYTMEAEGAVVPQTKPQPPTVQNSTVYATPPPVVFNPPPPLPVAEPPQYKLVKVDMSPKVEEEDEVEMKLDMRDQPKMDEIEDRPIHKTVAVIQNPEKQPQKYVVVKSNASPPEETKVSLDTVDSRFTAETVEYKVRSQPTLQRQFIVRNSASSAAPQKTPVIRAEKRHEVSRDSDQKYRTSIEVKDVRHLKPESNDTSTYSYSEDATTQNFEQSDYNMRVVRGSYLIKNQLDEVDSEFDDNINMFHGEFNLTKDNPLYQSDEDIYRRFERETTEHAQKQQRFQRDVNPDITFETVDHFTKTKNIKRDEPPKQNLSQLLLSRISTIDAKDIRQNIDVKHHSEDIYGDPRFTHVDGTAVSREGTNNFDSVGEKVDLVIKNGKAFITIKVTAERITPVDFEFNVWRKNQAIVTRVVEVDLQATEQRRRLYRQVMAEAEPAGGSHGTSGWRAGSNETVLDSKQTLDIFTRILGATDGEGDHEDITVKSRQSKTTRPFSSGMDMLY